MMKVPYFRHTKTGRTYRVMSVSKDKKVVTLKGEHAEFTQPYDKEQFKKLGYVLELVEE